MKQTALAALTVACALALTSCSLLKKDDNDLGGSTDVSFAQVGNQITLGTVEAGEDYLPIEASLTVTKNDKGEGTARVEFNVEEAVDNPAVQTLAQFIMDQIVPGHTVDASGNVSAQVRFKATSEGLLDYVYGEPFVIVKYADGVGTKYTAETPDGVKQTREIVEKTGVDDFPFGFMYIKVSKVEQELNDGGVRKLTYYVNHKFGLVYWEVTLDDGSTVGSYLYSVN